MEGHQPRQVPPHTRESDQDSLRPLLTNCIRLYNERIDLALRASLSPLGFPKTPPLTDEEILAASRDLRLVTIEDNPCLWRYDYPWGEEDFSNAAPRLW